MQNYLVLYHATPEAMQAMMQSTPEQMQSVMGAWKAWADRCGDALVEMAPLSGGQRMTAAGSSSSGMGIVTYAVLQANDMASAQALLADHPHLNGPGCALEVHETMSLPW